MKNDFATTYKKQLESCLTSALLEDIGTGDHTSKSCIYDKKNCTAFLLVKESGHIAGIALSKMLCNLYDASLILKTNANDGDFLKAGAIAFTISGKIQSILAIERLILNSMQRMSGIATHTRQLLEQIRSTYCQLLDARKTKPNFRYPEKWAVQIGGGSNHRMGLFDAILLKDNHIDAVGTVGGALEKTKTYLETHQLQLPVIVEARQIDEVYQIIKYPFVNRILLDNMSPNKIGEALEIISGRFPCEASGNITQKNIVEYAQTGVEFLSVGALTYSSKAIDLSLKIKA
ncbi:MAG: carboxylating nicotinate-nucleotide diphosphorylase [Bacteroidetes bacterium]|nr:carboxylating nicotinate-nucleotide diphosphorylase [Bacteroidota bacterium]MDA0938031.1 carboxylating nicotinate-nucleotide diphosphorylase [Bacteroidota bacterium]MDA1343940.1 carboxylating nicotinate-nucleotide diphosphorylase [Bacteroidota bacterium]